MTQIIDTPKTDVIDLSWVEFSEDESQSCTTTREDCNREAVWYGFYSPYMSFPDCNPVPVRLYCSFHYEDINKSMQQMGHPYFHCQHGTNNTGHILCLKFERWERIKK